MYTYMLLMEPDINPLTSMEHFNRK